MKRKLMSDLQIRELSPNYRSIYSALIEWFLPSKLNRLSTRVHFAKMTSNSLSHCCTTGSLHDGEAKGEIKNIGDSTSYLGYLNYHINQI
jgi:hypothetical protein